MRNAVFFQDDESVAAAVRMLWVNRDGQQDRFIKHSISLRFLQPSLPTVIAYPACNAQHSSSPNHEIIFQPPFPYLAISSSPPPLRLLGDFLMAFAKKFHLVMLRLGLCIFPVNRKGVAREEQDAKSSLKKRRTEKVFDVLYP
ncbi:hypothetical protein CABS01_16287 [Colletotrichum abscissum]|uniref:uncharacterized protein n=1 Tax=Colletotrichum abscissum TaxID=1671311 RepID=UPI0027D71B22|nr:uncharacterized protein CABS01_16287 [Colletotrichum abscissum]KAK1472556.1 hypothetical protein CABS01_16287 [Colletotrichum abscissum]